ncbi:MAG: glycosyltransferase [Planctomycetaceae bacterium]|jgi:glycosyltransferase involved in cell wall biosynthesis|nr:glycosyltransferase [Planctomycetaceae bacterium]
MPHRTKILQVVSSWESGAVPEIVEFVTRLPRNEFSSEICVLAGSKNRKISGIPATALNLRWSFDVCTYYRIGQILRRFRPDVVHTWDAAAQLYGTLHCGHQRIIAEKRFFDVQPGRLQKYLDKKTHRFILPRSMGNCPKTVIVPPAVPTPDGKPIPAEKLLEKLGFPLVEPSGDYYPVFQSQYEPARRSYKPTPQSPTPFLIGIVLPLDTEHKILDALWVFETLNHVHLNFHAFVIGDGKDSDQFLRYRDRWKLFSRVHFLGNQHDAYRLLPSFDVLLHLSPSAEYSGTILSAMSCGVPVIALETPESRDYVQDGTTGILIPAEGDFRFHRRTAAKRLLYLLENEELRRSMQRAAADRIENEFNFGTAVQRRIGLYRELVR